MASVLLPLFLPPGDNIDKFLRALVGVSIFASAYMAEVIRGGLQAIPKGQYEGADSLGLNYGQKMVFIIMPQAIKLVIPGIVNTFIGMFKDTSLVSIINMYDLLGIVKASFGDANWITPVTPLTGLIFAGFVFITLDENARPVAEIADGAEGEMRKFLPDLDNLVLSSETDVIVDANWKVIQENSIEGYHFDLSGPVHKDLAALIDFEGYTLTPYGDWWTYIGPPNKGAKEAYGVPLEGSTWQTD
eukprot:gene37355-42312_t